MGEVTAPCPPLSVLFEECCAADSSSVFNSLWAAREKKLAIMRDRTCPILVEEEEEEEILLLLLLREHTGGGRHIGLVVTWLILPAIICLSQRLSHACLSISNYTAKLRMAHYISYNLLDRFRYLDNCRNSRANTCNRPGPGQLGKGAFTRGETKWGESSNNG